MLNVASYSLGNASPVTWYILESVLSAGVGRSSGGRKA